MYKTTIQKHFKIIKLNLVHFSLFTFQIHFAKAFDATWLLRAKTKYAKMILFDRKKLTNYLIGFQLFVHEFLVVVVFCKAFKISFGKTPSTAKLFH